MNLLCSHAIQREGYHVSGVLLENSFSNIDVTLTMTIILQVADTELRLFEDPMGKFAAGNGATLWYILSPLTY